MLKQFGKNIPSNPNEMTLSYELNCAIVVENDELPEDSVRLNSQVRVKEPASNLID
ncbi:MULTISPECIES: hypothetical protein [Dyadobacter]|uniref:Uncharacterized protein n=2 Tax=Dyadobacter TaxID=120831 RepID=A0A9X1TGD0_9BACT|nr:MULTISPECIES: hypothetical protein [Dyadobacter]MCF0040327.1 hypothetical protein [Dyadobacter fanqingshengii]MCF2494850.1 hypothetical protein [Dyadobacter chenhuakuii]MCF2519071.1 hypothetical protein [Dyadobacter sp. CY351]USJ31832.1 hypothetical protein NFI80_03645 [Dyadobacter chenhuakuii]USJ37927.1 hypothetical protein NFI81_09100 [Dyadobacter fanqingshengii]